MGIAWRSGLGPKLPLPQLAQDDGPSVGRFFEVNQELRERLGPRIAA